MSKIVLILIGLVSLSRALSSPLVGRHTLWYTEPAKERSLTTTHIAISLI